jgi:hypothetical protein
MRCSSAKLRGCRDGASCCACIAGLSPWRDRGGRFASGFSGEQFALPEAVAALRAIRRRVADDSLVSVSGADSLNLAGILMPRPKLPALAGNRVLYRDDMPIAFLEGDSTRFLEVVEPEIESNAIWPSRGLDGGGDREKSAPRRDRRLAPDV